MATTVGMKLALEGEAQYKAGLQNIQQKSKELAAEMKAVISAGEGEEKQMEVLSKQISNQRSLIDQLGKKYEQQQKDIDNTKKAIDEAKEAYGENSAEVQKLETQLIKQETALSKTKTQLNNETDALNKMEKAADTAGKETDELGDETKEAGEEAKKAGNDGFTVFKGVVANLATDAIKGAIDGLKNLASSIGEAVSETAAYGDEIDKSSQKMGVSAEAYQELSYAMERSGADISSFQKGMINMNDALADFANGNEEAGDTYAKLGVSMRKADGRLKTSEELLMDTVDALANMEDTTQRDAAAQDIFGKKMTELRPLLNSGSKAIKDMMKEAKDYGMVMSDDAVSSSAAYEDSLTRLKGTMSGLKRSMVSEFLPGITKVMDGFSKMFAGVKGGNEDLNSGINSMIKSFTSKVPEFLKVGKEIFTSILQGVQENLPNIITAFTDVIPDLFSTLADLIENIDLGGLIKSVFGCINSIVVSIVPRIPELLGTLIEGIITALPDLFVGVGETILGIFEGLFGGYNKFDAFVDKIDRQTEAWDKVTEAMGTATDQVNNDYATWQSNWDLLQSITDSTGKVKDGYEGMAQALVEQLNGALGENIEIIGGQIQGYRDLVASMDEALEKKRAELILKAEEQAYDEAMAMRPELIQAVEDAQNNLTAAQEELTAAQKEYDGLVASGGDLTEVTQRMDKLKVNIVELQGTLDDATDNLQENTDLQTRYMDDYSAAISGDYDQIGRTVKKYTGSTATDLVNYQKKVWQQLDQDKKEHTNWLEAAERTQSEYAKSQAEYYQRRINEDQTQIAKIAGIIKQGGKDFTQGYVQGIMEDEASVTAAGEQVTTDALHAVVNTQQSHSPAKVTKGYGGDFSEGYRLGIEEKGDAVKTSAEGVAKKALGGIDSEKSAAKTAGSNIGSNFKTGIEGGKTGAYNAATAVAGQAKLGIESENENIKKVGEFAADGFIEGMKNKKYLVEQAAYSLAQGAKNKMKNTLEEQSPSKATMRIGEYAGEGLAIGMENTEKMVVNSAKELAGSLLDVDFRLNGADYVHASGAILSAAGASKTVSNAINVTVNAAEGQNANEIADYVIDKLQMQLIGSEAVYA